MSYSTFLAEGLPSRMPDKAEYVKFFSPWRYTTSYNLDKLDRHECNFYDINKKITKESIADSCVTPQSEQVIFLWGDSHAQHLNYGLSTILPAEVSLLQAGSSGCPPSTMDLSPDPLQTCNKSNRFVWDKLAALKPNVVILAQAKDHNVERHDAVIAHLKKIGVKTVLLIGPVPQWEPYLYKIILRKYWHYSGDRLNTYLNKKVLHTDSVLKARYKNENDVLYVSLVENLCNAQGCLTHLNNDRKEGLITYDYGHFTLPASEFVARTILAPVLKPVLNF